MDLELKISQTPALRLLLRCLCQTKNDYDWSRNAFFLIQPQKGRSPLVHAYLTNVSLKNENLKLGLAMVSCDRKEKNKIALPDKHHSLSDFLTTAMLQEDDSRQKQRDLLVALYYEEDRKLAEIYASVKKTIGTQSEIHSLPGDGQRDQNVPRYVFTLPQADSLVDWNLWLKSVNPKGSRGIRLFYKLPGSQFPEFYIEYGYVHPWPEIRDLYTVRNGIFCILISNEIIAGAKFPCWASLARSDKDVVMHHYPQDVFDVELSSQPQQFFERVASPSTRRDRIPLSPELIMINDESGERLSQITARIRTAKENLYHLEAERLHLLEQKKDSYRFLLRFTQAVNQEATERKVAGSFERFLMYTRHNLEQFSYAYQELVVPSRKGDIVAGYHILLTNEPVFYHEIPLEFSDEVYYQPEAWHEWGIKIFIRDGCELLPRISDANMADSIKSIFPEARGERGKNYYIIQPTTKEDRPFAFAPIEQNKFKNLAECISFHNNGFPAAEWVVRKSLQENIRNDLEEQKAHLDKTLEDLEQKIRKEATSRLDTAQRDWNSLAVKIEQSLQQVSVLHEQFENIESLLSDFAEDWQQGLRSMLHSHSALIRRKLKALEELERKKTYTIKILRDIVEASKNVKEILDRLEIELVAKKKEADENYDLSKKKYDVVKDQADLLEKDITAKKKEVEESLRKSQAAQKKCEEINRRLKEQVDKASKLDNALVDLLKRIKDKADEFDKIIKKIRSACAEIDTRTDRLDKLNKAIEETHDQWVAKKREFNTKEADVDRTYDTTKLQVESIKNDIEARHKRVENKAAILSKEHAAVDRKLQDLDEKIKKIAADIQNLIVKRKKWVVKTKQIREKRKELKEANRKWEGTKKRRDRAIPDLRNQLEDLQKTLEEIQKTRTAKVDEYIKSVEQMSAAFQALSDMERSVDALEGLREAARNRESLVRPTRSMGVLPKIWGNAGGS